MVHQNIGGNQFTYLVETKIAEVNAYTICSNYGRNLNIIGEYALIHIA
jgi:hypothetical protein